MGKFMGIVLLGILALGCRASTGSPETDGGTATGGSIEASAWSEGTASTDAWILAYFGDDCGAVDDSLYLAWSTDGLHWTALNDGDPVYTPTIGSGHIRDPYLFRKNDGTFVFISTDWTPYTGAASYWSTCSPMLYVADSTDLITYSNARLMRVAPTYAKGSASVAVHAWAPEVTYDPAAKKYAILWSGNDASGFHRTYISYTTDFKTAEHAYNPTVFFEAYDSQIDATVVPYNGKYYLFYKDANWVNYTGHPGRGNDILTAVSDSFTAGSFSPISVADSYYQASNGFTAHDYLDWYITRATESAAGYTHIVNYEGPFVVKAPNTAVDTWYLYADQCDYEPDGNFGCFYTTDLSDPKSWRAMPSSKYSFPYNVRHANTVRVTKAELDTLIAHFTAVAVNSVTLSEHSLALDPGSAETLTATISPANATASTVTWASSDEAVAVVSASGRVYPTGSGTASITATASDGSKSDTCSVTVNSSAVTAVSLDRASVNMVVGGATVDLVATVAPNLATTKQGLSWSSGNTAVATVDNSGRVTAVAEGSTSITATSSANSGASANCAVSVAASSGDASAPAAVTGVTATAGVTGQVILTWSDPADSDFTQVKITNSQNSTVAWATRGAKTIRINDLTVGTATTFTLAAMDLAGNLSATATATATPVQVTYAFHSYNYLVSSITTYLMHTKTATYDTWDCAIGRADQSFPQNQTWIVRPGLANPQDGSLVSLQSSTYPAYYLRISSSSPFTYPTSSGQWYGWALAGVTTTHSYLCYANADDGTATFEGDATFRVTSANDGTSAWRSIQWYQDPSRYLTVSYYHVFGYRASDYAASFDAYSSWKIE